MNDDVMLAAGLLPTLQRLYKAGVISIGETSDRVHLREDLFHAAFKTWYTVDRRDGFVEHRHNLGGAVFFCLVHKEKKDGRA